MRWNRRRTSLDLKGGSDDREPMTVAASETMPLRALLARIWRDYLSKHKGSLILSVLCAATTGCRSA